MKKELVLCCLFVSLGCAAVGAADGNGMAADAQVGKQIAPYTVVQRTLTADDFNKRGIYYASQQSYDQAEADFQQAVSLAKDTKHQSIYGNNLAMTYARLGKYTLAMKTINKVLTLTPRFVNAMDTKGDILIGMKRYKEAEDYLTNAMSLHPNVGTFYYTRARAYEGMRKHDQAVQDYRQTLLLPGDYKTKAKQRLQEWKLL